MMTLDCKINLQLSKLYMYLYKSKVHSFYSFVSSSSEVFSLTNLRFFAQLQCSLKKSLFVFRYSNALLEANLRASPMFLAHASPTIMSCTIQQYFASVSLLAFSFLL